jgi:hypothetical protein
LVIPENYGFNNEIELEMKILVEIEFYTLDENGENNKMIETFTYKIPKSNLTFTSQDIFPNLSSSNFNIDFPKNLNFNNVTFDGSNVSGCILSGNSYTCKAREKISISGNISTASGYNVNFIAGEEIVKYPESVINGEIIRHITPFYNYSHPMPQVKAEYIQSYCDNNINSPYRADLPTKVYLRKPQIINESENPSKDINFNFNIYPNPTTSTSTVVLSGNNETNYNIEVTDMMGKVVYTKGNRAETTQTVLDLTGISKGVYFVKVNTLLGTKMKQLVIQ